MNLAQNRRMNKFFNWIGSKTGKWIIFLIEFCWKLENEYVFELKTEKGQSPVNFNAQQERAMSETTGIWAKLSFRFVGSKQWCDLYDLFCIMMKTAPMVIVQWGPKIEKLGTWKKMETKYRPNICTHMGWPKDCNIRNLNWNLI